MRLWGGAKRAAPFCFVRLEERSGACSTVGPFSTDAYIPNIPQIRKDFDCPVYLATLTLQLNWVSNALANSLCGTLSDRLGRRKTALTFLSIYLVGTAICGLAPSVWWLAAGRVIQGVGQGASVLPSAIARDLVDDPGDRMQAMAFLGSLRPIIIISAPTVGGSLGSLLGWRYIFYVLGGWTVLTMVFLVLTLPESHRPRAGDEGGPGGGGPAKAAAPDLKRLFSSRLYVGFVFLLAIEHPAQVRQGARLADITLHLFELGLAPHGLEEAFERLWRPLADGLAERVFELHVQLQVFEQIAEVVILHVAQGVQRVLRPRSFRLE